MLPTNESERGGNHSGHGDQNDEKKLIKLEQLREFPAVIVEVTARCADVGTRQVG